ncbi:5-methylcytosine rRNA methyltransferase NSUN4 [Thrips palmi]|uniref:NOL1/NOP2/Sun domain family member 4 n=1 Tax=Thrips palmi TaxID=161013 RepID=A0A6P8ZYY8_THRPL|nr:5-methylcytosine rRNA methyltransferase NSUN4 [Thrips palmi]
MFAEMHLIRMTMLCHKFVSCTKRVGSHFCYYNSKRWASNAYKELERERNRSTTKALSHFDDFYGSLFQEQWPSIRVALLSAPKRGVVVNNFSDKERILKDLQNEGAYNIREIFEEQQKIVKDKFPDEVLMGSQDVYQVEGSIEEMLLRQQRADSDQIYPEPLHSISSEISRNSASKQFEEKASDDDDNFKVSEDPTKDLPLSETLKTADYDKSRLIAPGPLASEMSASLYDFVPATKLKGMDDYIPESAHYSYYKESPEAPIEIEPEDDIHFPHLLDIFAYERGNCDAFQLSQKGSTDVFDYHIISLGSLAPVLALDVKKGDVVLDLTSLNLDIPIIISQTLVPGLFIMNCDNTGRAKYFLRTMKSYFYDAGEMESNIHVSDCHPLEMEEKEKFNKIIVSVPNTRDRQAVTSEEENLFNPARVKQRIKIPEVQTAFLRKALELVKEGGTVVYVTESMSPIQNDGVVQKALEDLWTSSGMSFTIKDLSKGFEPLLPFMKITTSGKYGHLVVPFLPNNCGPLYFSKIVKNIEPKVNDVIIS